MARYVGPQGQHIEAIQLDADFPTVEGHDIRGHKGDWLLSTGEVLSDAEFQETYRQRFPSPVSPQPFDPAAPRAA